MAGKIGLGRQNRSIPANVCKKFPTYCDKAVLKFLE